MQYWLMIHEVCMTSTGRSSPLPLHKKKKNTKEKKKKQTHTTHRRVGTGGRGMWEGANGRKETGRVVGWSNQIGKGRGESPPPHPISSPIK